MQSQTKSPATPAATIDYELSPFCGEWYSKETNFGLWISVFLLDETHQIRRAEPDLRPRKVPGAARENLYSVSEDLDDGGTAAEIKRAPQPAIGQRRLRPPSGRSSRPRPLARGRWRRGDRPSAHRCWVWRSPWWHWLRTAGRRRHRTGRNRCRHSRGRALAEWL